MKRIFILLLSALSVTAILAQKYPCQKQIESGQYEKAKATIDKYLTKNPHDVTYLFAYYKLLENTASPYFNPKEAYLQIVHAQDAFNSNDAKEQAKLIKKEYTANLLTSSIENISRKWLNKAKKENTVDAFFTYLSVCTAAPDDCIQEAISNRNKLLFEIVRKNNTVEQYNNFINNYPDAEQIPEAIRLRNTAAFVIAKQQNTITAYKEYIQTYPDAVEVEEANKAICELSFAEVEKENTESAYRKFLELFPNTPQAEIATQRVNQIVYETMTADGSMQSYLSYIELYPSNQPQVEQAEHELLKIAIYSDAEDVQEQLKKVNPLEKWLNEEDKMYTYNEDNNKVSLGGKYINGMAYEAIYANCFICHSNGHVGVVTEDKLVCVPFIYDDIQPVPNDKYGLYSDYLFTRKNGLVGLLYRMVEVYPPVLKSFKFTKPAEVVEADGTKHVFTTYEQMYEHANMLRAKEHNMSLFNPDNSDVKTLNLNTNKYNKEFMFSDGMMPFYDMGVGMWGFVNTNGEVQIEPSIPSSATSTDNKTPIFKSGFCVLRNMGNSITILDKDGNVHATINRKFITFTDFNKDGLALAISEVNRTTCKYALYNTEGKEVYQALYAGNTKATNYGYYIPVPYPFHDGVALFFDGYSQQGRTYGICDVNGKIIKPASFLYAHDFSEGLAVAKRPASGSTPALWGYINTKGEWVIGPKFTNEPDDFHEGLALVQNGEGNWVFIDTLGIVQSEEYRFATPFYKGHAFVEDLDNQKKTINRHFTTIAYNIPIHTEFQKIQTNVFQHGMVAFNQYGEYAYNAGTNAIYDAVGKQITFYPPFSFKFKAFSEDMIYIEYQETENSPWVDAMMDFTGKVLFIIKQPEW